MPARGYRKGATDDKVPLPHRLHTRVSARIHGHLAADAEARGLTTSRLISSVLEAWYEGRDLPGVKPGRDAQAIIRELRAIGNNLNQLTRIANTPRLTVPTEDLARALDRVLDACRRV